VTRRRRLRTRLFVAMAAIAVGVLLVTGVVTIALARRGAARTAEQELRTKAPGIADQLEQLGQRLRVRRAEGLSGARVNTLIARVLNLSGGTLVTVTNAGTVNQVPTGLQAGDLDLAGLASGTTQSGRSGNLAFVAEPLTPTAAGTPVLVLTQQIESSTATRARGFFLVGSALAAGIAMLVAFFLARRLTRPLAAMRATADAIARGDLTARVDLGPHPDDELADLAGALNSMATDLEHGRGLERAFLLSVSHDLRTPLTSIRGYAEALTDGTIPATDEQRRAAAVIGAESRRLERLVNDLLDLARLDARQFSLHPRTVDAAVVVGAALDAFRPAADDLGLTLTLLAPEPLPLTTDPDRLAQIVANLVENALKYARAQIVVEVRRVGPGTLELRVQDDGPGIAPADEPHVFDRLFVSRDRPGRSVGTGLGLAIVHELASALGGTATVDTAPGAPAGACFSVRLPAQLADRDVAAVDAHH
jgi:two-component system sensor histidine kinase BaeS